MADMPRIVLTGGVSGGHTFPLIAVARALRTKFPQGVEFLFIGSRGRFESEAMADEEIPAKYVLTGKWRRYFSLQNFIDLFRLPLGFFQALWHLFRFMPDAVFSKGGSASVPIVLAAWLYRIPVLIHDSDAVAGKANLFLARFASRVAIAYPSAHKFFPEEKTAQTGNPVREEILKGSAEDAQRQFGLVADQPVILVIGGSQGARILNEAILRVLPELLKDGVQIVHQTGSEHQKEVVMQAEERGIGSDQHAYIPRPFFSADELADLLACATLVISRAGAGSIAEIAATKKASILVPLASAANDEQRMNAYDIAAIGGALVLEEANLGVHIFHQKIIDLLKNDEARRAMEEKVHAFYHADAADQIAEGVLELIHNR